MAARHVALNRFGLGARVGERLPTDPREWLLGQLEGRPPQLAGATPTMAEISAAYRAQVTAVRSQDQARRQAAARVVAELANREVTALLSTRVSSDRPFAERWVAFWSNHLCVSAAAGIRISSLAGSYERDAIRPHVFGRFEEMLLASAHHPAMLAYLNNAQSIGPKSAAATRRRRANAPPGLNENYARELLELHTVGVDGGYSQTDVEQLARVLTGWTVAGLGGPLDQGSGQIGFRFLPQAHEPGSKTVLGTNYRDAGEAEGVGVIRDLARKPATARFLATKLARHFIADDPPAAAVDRLAAVYAETGGDLRQVAIALVKLEESWHPDHRKFRTPQDWLVALMRAVGAREVAPNLGRVLRQLGHQLWAPGAPKGYGDLTREWADSDSLMNRAELARTIAGQASRGRRPTPVDPRPLADVMALASDDPLPGLLADGTIPVAERIALAFAGPAFQWR